jgi:deoxyribodipyrimidine photo-lyase
VIPVAIRDDAVDGLGAAAKWRLGQALAHFGTRLSGIGSRLVLRSGPALEVLKALVAETGADTLVWSRLYDGASVERDTKVKDWAKAHDITAKSFNAALLHEPWTVETQEGAPYRVFTPYWRAVKGREVAEPLPPPHQLRAPGHGPDSDTLESWRMDAALVRGASVLARHANVGEETAHRRFGQFLAHRIGDYGDARNSLGEDGTSGMSEPLTWGEVSPRTLWHGALRARAEGAAGAEAFLRQLAWRDFAWHLFYHRPDMGRANWRADWDAFPWRGDNADAKAWRRGRTGIDLVDAAMREMYVTGRMHNRARMVVASYLTKHLLTDWRVGLAWFADCLTDWDEASNALGWQWVAGSGPDAAPFFRVFNPDGQAGKFDPDGRYRRRWLAEGAARPTATALSYYDAIPKAWGLAPMDERPDPVVGLAAGRSAALAAYERARR